MSDFKRCREINKSSETKTWTSTSVERDFRDNRLKGNRRFYVGNETCRWFFFSNLFSTVYLIYFHENAYEPCV